MKRQIFQLSSLALFVLMLTLAWSCKKDESTPKTAPTGVTTSAATSITPTGATIGGSVTADGGSALTALGVVYSKTNATPTTDADDTELASGKTVGSFSVVLTGLDGTTKYYARAFATNGVGITYGSVVEFTTTSLPVPLLTTADVTGIQSRAAMGGGNITNDFGATVTERGVCWSESNDKPDLSGSFATATVGGAGSFSVNMADLLPSTSYYVRAYAKSANGTGYGSTVQFVTKADKPEVTTGAISNITNTSSLGGGVVVNENGATVTARGVCWSTSPNPTVSNERTTNGSGAGSFSSTISGLAYGTKYYVRAYATNSEGTSYGSQVTFETSGVKDIQGNTYNTVKIGTQTWMAENLRVTMLNDGGTIYNDRSLGASYWTNYSEGYYQYCWYDNNSAYKSTYGGLYNFKVVESGKLCPTGWRVPTEADFQTLISTIGGASQGGKLKSTSGWNFSSSGGATNSTGFSAIASGWIDAYGTFYDLGAVSYFRTQTPTPGNSIAAIQFRLNYNNANIDKVDGNWKRDGSSVRCIKE